MTYYGVDVRTPIFYRHSFANALETQSSKTFARLTHTPVIAEHLAHGSATGARITQYATHSIHSLEDLEKLLCTVLDCDPSAAAVAAARGRNLNLLSQSMRETWVDELERAAGAGSGGVSFSASTRKPVEKTSESIAAKKSSKGSAAVTSSAATVRQSSDAAHPAATAAARKEDYTVPLSSSMAGRRLLPRSVSFPALSSGHSPRGVRGTSSFAATTANVDPSGHTAETHKPGFWRRLIAAVLPGTTNSVKAQTLQVDTRVQIEAPLDLNNQSAPAVLVSSRPPAKTSTSSRVPAWVRTAFSLQAAAAAAATVDTAHPSTVRASRGAASNAAPWRGVSMLREERRDGGDALVAAAAAATRKDFSLDEAQETGVMGLPIPEPVTQIISPAPQSHTASASATASAKDGGWASGSDGPAAALRAASRTSPSANSASNTNLHISREPSVWLSNSGNFSLSERLPGNAEEQESDSTWKHSGLTAAPSSPDHTSPTSPVAPPSSTTRTNVPNGSGSANTTVSSPSLPTPTPKEVQARKKSTQQQEQQRRSAAVMVHPTNLAEAEESSADDSAERTAHTASHDASASHAINCCTGGPSPRSHRGPAQTYSDDDDAVEREDENVDKASAPSPSEQSHTTAAGTSVWSRWDRRAYAVELVGWLHLLVWVRFQVILFLRDLSGVQGLVAWSAWYWSWAQDHPRQAVVHQALSSRRFWTGLWSRGCSAEFNGVQYEVSGHMFTLKSTFRLIVSYIGAAYTALEELNAVIAQVQHHCEVAVSPIAVAAATAAVRPPAGRGVGATPAGQHLNLVLDLGSTTAPSTVPEFLPYQNGIFWTPAPTAGDEFSPLLKVVRDHIVDGPVDPAVLPASALPKPSFVDPVDQTSAAETVAEEAEAATALHALDEIRQAVWTTLQEQRMMFRSSSLRLDVLDSNDHYGYLWDGTNTEGRTGNGTAAAAAVAAAAAAASVSAGASPHLMGHEAAGIIGGAGGAVGAMGLAPSGESIFFNTVADAVAANDARVHGTSPQLHQNMCDGPHALCERSDGGRGIITARDGAFALLQSVQRSKQIVQRLKVLVKRSHNPPASRHWQRVLFLAATTIPPFVWLYTKTPSELFAMVHRRYSLGRQLVKSYLLDPIAQLRESFFYVRPGVEDRRGAFDRDAASLANVIRDFHEDMYPNMPQDRLEELRVRTLQRLRAGVADPEGLGLIDEQYRHSVRHPILSMFVGDLPRIMLIQLSYQALEMSRVANGVDEVLEGNDLNFKIMALMPVFVAGGLLLSWSLFRYRATYKPVRMRMKLLWRSLFRVVSFAGRSQTGGVVRGRHVATHEEPQRGHRRRRRHHRAPDASLTMNVSHLPQAVGSAAAAATAAADRHVEEIDPAAFGDSDSDGDGGPSSNEEKEDSSSLAGSLNTGAGASSVRQLNYYEQGMVLLLSHVIRSVAAEYLRSYEFFHELIEDLNDLESVQSSRHQRLETLERMRATHVTLF